MNMVLTDCHTHTMYSMDSDADINTCIKRAISLGLEAYAITDHCECNFWYPKEHYGDTDLSEDFNYCQDFEASVSAVTELKEKYSSQINLLCGTEMGQAMLDLEIAEKIISDHRLDFIIGSVHQIKNEKDFFFIEYDKMTESEIYNLLERYFTEINELCKWGKFDVLGHLTYCMRYMKCRNGIEPDISRFDDIIADCFRSLAEKGKGIEINTSGIRQGFGECFPSLKYVKMFRDMGGEIITVGSDAHTADDIGKNINDGILIAENAGFKYISYFKERTPCFIKITQ